MHHFSVVVVLGLICLIWHLGIFSILVSIGTSEGLICLLIHLELSSLLILGWLNMWVRCLLLLCLLLILLYCIISCLDFILHNGSLWMWSFFLLTCSRWYFFRLLLLPVYRLSLTVPCLLKLLVKKYLYFTYLFLIFSLNKIINTCG